MKNFFRRRLVEPVLELLKQGLTVEKLSMSLSAGLVICCFPIIGLTTILCVLCAVIFRLNHVAIQITNYFGYPLQLALIIPFLHAGNWIFGHDPMKFNLDQMLIEFQRNWILFLQTYGAAAARAVVAWMFFAPIAFIICYYIIKLILKKASCGPWFQ